MKNTLLSFSMAISLSTIYSHFSRKYKYNKCSIKSQIGSGLRLLLVLLISSPSSRDFHCYYSVVGQAWDSKTTVSAKSVLLTFVELWRWVVGGGGRLFWWVELWHLFSPPVPPGFVHFELEGHHFYKSSHRIFRPIGLVMATVNFNFWLFLDGRVLQYISHPKRKCETYEGSRKSEPCYCHLDRDGYPDAAHTHIRPQNSICLWSSSKKNGLKFNSHRH